MGFKDLCRDRPKDLESLDLLRNDGPPMMGSGGGGFNRDSRDSRDYRGGNKVRRCGYNINRYGLIITGLFFSPIEEDLKEDLMLRGSLTSHYC